MTIPTDAELLPCPFCGSKEVNIADDLITFYGECGSCGATAAYSSYRAGAVQAWNRRAPQTVAGGGPVAWRTFDGEGGYDYRAYEGNENYRAEWDKRNPNHKGWVEPLYAPQPTPVREPQPMPDLTQLTGRGAKAWAGVDAQELREGFTAADMATAAAQGFRDGAASGAASAGSEPVAWVDERALSWLANSRSLSATITTKLEKGKSFERPMPLYLHPSPSEGMVGGWISVEERLPDMPAGHGRVNVLAFWDDGETESSLFYGRNSWQHGDGEMDYHRDSKVTHWMPLPPPPTTSAGSGKGE